MNSLCPKCLANIDESWTFCPKCGSHVQAGGGQAGAIPISFSNLRAEYIGRLVTLEGFISGESPVKAAYTKYLVRCHECGVEEEINLRDDPLALFEILAIRNDGKARAKAVELFRSHNMGECRHKKVMVEPAQPMLLYYVVNIREFLERTEDSVAKNCRAYLLDSITNEKDVHITGYLTVNPVTANVELLGLRAEPLDGVFKNFTLSDEEVAELRTYFSTRKTLDEFLILAERNNPRIAGRRESKLSSLLTWVSPTWIIINDERRAGVLRILYFGDPRTGKGRTACYLHEKLRLGKHAVGETSSRTGLSYTIDPDLSMIVWGALVEADKTILVVEALHKFPPDDMATLREALVKLYVEVRRRVTAKAWARTRIIADANPRREMAAYPFKCMALRDLECFRDAVDITRWDLLIPFCAGDVPEEDMVKAITEGKDDEEFIRLFRKLVLWMWSRKPEDIVFTREAIEEAKKRFEVMKKNYATSEIPVIHEDSFFTLLKIAASFAALAFSSPDGVKLEVKQDHVKLAGDFVEKIVDMLELSDFIAWRGRGTLTEDEYETFRKEVDASDVLKSVIEILLLGPATSNDLAAQTGHGASWIREKLAVLKAGGYVVKAARGYMLTAKGVQAWKRYTLQNRQTRQQDKGGTPLKPFAILRQETPIRWQPCPFCGKSRLEFYVKFVDGEETYICEECAKKLKEAYAGGQ